MKKYLMMGAAALAISSAFVGCTKDKDLYDPTMNAQKFLENYQQAFIEVFGQPAANQTWGFGDAAGARMTRAGNMTGVDSVAQTSDGINANANEWADKAGTSHGHGGWIVPDPLTEKQKAVVAAYFQTVKPLTYTDPKWPNFFVQQVYKGDSIVKHGDTTEGIVAANGTSQYASGNMNLLTVGRNHQHINNFNRGTASSVGVLNKNHTANEFDTNQHPDQIMLMVNIDDTECMGYHETGSSTHHDDKAALVSWETIDTWAKSNYTGYDGCLKDDWNRSFVGFDLALKSQEDSYAKGNNGEALYATFTDVPNWNNMVGAWDGTNTIKFASANASQGNDLTDMLSNITRWGNGSVTKSGDIYVYDAQSGFHINNVGGRNWSTYEKLVIELAEGAPNGNLSMYIKNNSQDVANVNIPEGATSAEIDLNGKGWDNITDIYFMGASSGTFKISKLYLVGDAPVETYYDTNSLSLRLMDSNLNQYAGRDTTITDGDLQYTVDGKIYLNLETINGLLDKGFLPVSGSAMKTWAKWEDSDGYFSDWIVTLTEAQRQDVTPVKPSLHVLCEDLTAQDANDFDFNDVVFDVFYVDANTVTIKVLAAGGTLPLRLCGRSNWEVHTLYNVDVKCMVNTGKKYHVATSPYTQQEGLGVKELTYTGFNGWSDDQNTFASQVNEKIKIEVQREENGEWVELTAPVGGPTAKIATPVNIYMKDADWYPEEYRWAWEKQNICKSFSHWVSNPGSVWYTTK